MHGTHTLGEGMLYLIQNGVSAFRNQKNHDISSKKEKAITVTGRGDL
jgi:hypothetical protein